MKTYLITGGDSNLAKHFKQQFPHSAILLSKKSCDVTSENSIEAIFKKYKFDYVLNCAAITDIELCEKNPALCFQVNVIGPYLLNKYCLKYHKKLLNISSDYATYPVNVYGWSKRFGEQVLDKSFLSIRTNFYSSTTYLVDYLRRGQIVNAYTNVYFNPLSIYRLVSEIDQNSHQRGVINLLTTRKISNYDFARKICATFGIKLNQVKKNVLTNSPGKAKRPFSSYLKPDNHVNLDLDLQTFKVRAELEQPQKG